MRKTYLKKPDLLITDSGKEFMSDIFQNYLEKENIGWKKAVGQRHRQIGMVERRNYTIGRAIAMKQQAVSMITQKENKNGLLTSRLLSIGSIRGSIIHLRPM